MNIPTLYPTVKAIGSFGNILFVVGGAWFYILSDFVLLIFIIHQTLSE